MSAADPVAAARILPGNARRVVRALEVIELTGQSFSAELPEHRYRLADVVEIGIAVDRPTLDARIAARVDAMWAAGFVDEVRRLATAGLRESLAPHARSDIVRYCAISTGRSLRGRLEIAPSSRRVSSRVGRSHGSRKDARITWLPYDHPGLVSAAYALAGPAGTGGPDSLASAAEMKD